MIDLESLNNVSIIIPTTCSKARGDVLFRAIDSALNHVDVLIEVIVLVNGNRYDQALLDKLKNDKRLVVFYLPDGNVSRARYYGICHSKYDYFAFLDDDDMLLPNTLQHRIDILNVNKDVAVAVSNGYFFNGGDNVLVDAEFYKKIQDSQVISFLSKNWFASPAVLYNKKRLDLNLFDFDYRYFELTYIFFKLIEKKYKIVFIEATAYRCFQDTVLSESKSEAYMTAYPEMLKVFISMRLSDEVKKILKQKYVVGLNYLSNYYLDKGGVARALYYHLRCLASGGWRYFFYIRKFLM